MSTNQRDTQSWNAHDASGSVAGDQPVIPPRRPVSRRVMPQVTGSASASHPAVREIHKHAWLKKFIAQDRRPAPFVRKYERQWVVFCVHDDIEAFLEFYNDPKMGAAHRPTSFVSLKNCLHVTPSIVGQEKEFEFTVTLTSEVIRLVANTWEQMAEWVESLQGKLREMNILSPKDNVYSKPPEICSANISYPLSRTVSNGPVTTRDPNSPLPPPPVQDTRSTLGGVVPHADEFRISETSNVNQGVNHSLHHQSALSSSNRRIAETITPVLSDSPGVGEVEVDTDFNASVVDSTSSKLLLPVSQVDPVNGAACSSQCLEVSNIEDNRHVSRIDIVSVETDAPRLPDSAHSSRSILANPAASTDCSNVKDKDDGSAQDDNENETSISKKTSARLEHKTRDSKDPHREIISHMDTRNCTRPIVLPRSASSENLYEYLFIPEAGQVTRTTREPVALPKRNGEIGLLKVDDSDPPVYPRKNRHASRNRREASTRSSSLNRIKDRENEVISTSKMPSARNFRRQAQLVDIIRPREHFVETHAASVSQSRAIEANRPLEAAIGIRSGEYRIRREEPLVSHIRNREIPDSQVSSIVHIPLKEQQVLRLKSEIAHHAGVRVVLRKKDCIGSIALIDYLGAVWVAGWKQQQFPVLYYAFHVGDQVMKIAGVTVQSSAEAQRAIKLNSSMQVEFVIRRLPYGRVYVIKRSKDGESLGLTLTGNSGEIGGVVKSGLSDTHGLPANATSTNSPCNWFLTEINSRPLSLFAKETEVKDRLNAVGKEISILVQPADLVKHIRKQLKLIKSFKDYVIG